MEEGQPWDALTVEDVLGPVGAACPSFRAAWADLAIGGWAWDANGFTVMSLLADHLVELRQLGGTDEIRATFAAIEEMLVDARPALDELLTVHFIDNLQTEARQSGDWVLANGFIEFLGPQMRIAWTSALYSWRTDHGMPPTL